MNSVYDIQELESACRDTHLKRGFCNAWFKKGLSVAACLEIAPELEPLSSPVLTLEERHDSKIDGASKLILKCVNGGAKIEAVILRISTGRTSLCISSQFVCAANCTFCAT